MRKIVLCSCLLLLAACIRAHDPLRVRYFSPLALDAGRSPAEPLADCSPFRLGRGTAAAHLKEALVWRSSDTELGFAEDRRWTEEPEVFLERALEEELVYRRGLRTSQAADVPVLQADLLAFEEWLVPRHEARVSFELRLTTSAGRPLFRRRVSATAAVEGARPERVVEALAQALRESVNEIAPAVVEVLRRPSSDGP